MASLEIQDRPFDAPASQALIEAMEAEMDELYRVADQSQRPEELEVDEALVHVTFAMVQPPDGAFVVAVLDGIDVGCAAMRLDSTSVGDPTVPRSAELKRMYVAPSARGRGVARAILAGLEDRALARGYGRMVLETGDRQPEAIALYESAGYTPISSYGAYRASSLARCFAKPLG